jgi:alpha-tubulin suppressor-like RCC1 family protein
MNMSNAESTKISLCLQDGAGFTNSKLNDLIIQTTASNATIIGSSNSSHYVSVGPSQTIVNSTLNVRDSISVGGVVVIDSNRNLVVNNIVSSAIANINANSISDGALNPLYGGTGATAKTGTGANVLSVNPAFDATTGSPFTVASTTLVTNLNAQLLNGQNASFYKDLGSGITGTLPIANGGTASTIATGTGSVVLASNPTITGTLITSNINASGIITGNGSGLTSLNGTSVTSGSISVAIGGTGATAKTGTGANVLSTNPAFDAITGSPFTVASTTLVSNLNAEMLNGQNAAFYKDLGSASGTLPIASGGTGTNIATGTGSVVLSSNPTFTGTVTTSNINFTGSLTQNGIPFSTANANAITSGSLNPLYGGTGATAKTGTGSNVLSTNPAFDAATGTTPFTVASTTLVTNLNAQLLNGQNAAFYKDLGNITGTLAVANGGTGSTIATGTGSVVLSANPVLTGTLTTSNITASGVVSGNGSGLTNLNATNITTGTLVVAMGGTGSTTATGTGSVALSSNPTFTGTVSASNINFTGSLTQNGTPFSTTNASVITSGSLNPLYGGTGATTKTGTGANVLSMTPTFDATTGTSPFTVASTTIVANLNAQLLNGQNAAFYKDLGTGITGTLAIVSGGTGTTTSTGTGSTVLSTNPTITGTLTTSNITASGLVSGNGSGLTNLNATNITTGTLAIVSGGTGTTTSTGTGSTVLSTNPTFTGTVSASNINFTGSLTQNGTPFSTASANAITSGSLDPLYGGTGATTKTGTGANVLSTTPAFDAATGTSPFTVASTTLVTNLNAQMLNGQNAAFYKDLGSGSITGTLAIANGGTGSTIATGTGSTVLSANPVLTGTLTTSNITASGVMTGNGSGLTTLNGTNITSGSISVTIGGTGATAKTGTGVNVLSTNPAFDVATGTSPFTVASTTLVSNLNAQLLNGQNSVFYKDLGTATGTLATVNGGTGTTTSTGTGSVVLSANPVLTGTLNISNVTASGVFTGNGSGLTTLNGTNITSGIVAVANGGTGTTVATGTGSVVLSANPTFSGTVSASNINFIGSLTQNGIAFSTTNASVTTSGSLNPFYGGTGATAKLGVVVTRTIGSSYSNGFAIATNGLLYAWGLNNYGQIGNNTTITQLVATVISGGSLIGKTVIAIAGGAYHTISLDSTGQVHAWGNNGNGQLGNNTTIQVNVPTIISSFGSISGKTIIAISCGTYYTIALDSVGQVHAWGANYQGQLGNNVTTNSGIPIAISTFGSLSGTTITAIACGTNVTMALDTNGKVHTWGNNLQGQLGNNTTTQSNIPIDISSFGSLSGKTVVAIACGALHSMGLDSTGQVHVWGENTFGGLGNNTTTQSNVPIAISSFGSLSGKTIIAIACGSLHTMGLDSTGQVHTWGYNGYGQLGKSNYTSSSVPVNVSTFGTLIGTLVVALIAGANHTLALDSSGTVHAWGYNNEGELGNNTTTPSNVSIKPLSNINTLYATTGTGANVLSTNPAFDAATGTTPFTVASTTMVTNLNAQLLNGSNSSYYKDLGTATGTLAIASGGTGTTVATGTGSVVLSANPVLTGTLTASNVTASGVFTGNGSGLTTLNGTNITSGTVSVTIGGTGATAKTGTGANVLSTNPAFDVATGTTPFTVASTTLVTNLNAQMLNGQNSSYYKDLGTATGTLAIANGGTGTTVATGTGSVVLSANPTFSGTVSASNINFTGSLTQNGTPFSTTNANVITSGTLNPLYGGSGAILKSYSRTLCSLASYTGFVISNGLLYAWGLNNYGQIGNNTTITQLAATLIAGGSLNGQTVVAISGGLGHTIALDSIGQVHTWGYNVYGQLGNNTQTQSIIPNAISTFGSLSGKTIIAVSCGTYHTIALDSVGQVHTWGYNQYGQLGNNNQVSQSKIPIAISTFGSISGKTVISVACGQFHTMALDSTGIVHAWGYNINGQLGNNTTTQSNTPISLSSFGSLIGVTIVAIQSGQSQMMALDSTGQVHMWGDNGLGQLGNNTTTQPNIPIAISSFGSLSGKTITTIASGPLHTMVLDSTGQIHTWGNNQYGALGNNTLTRSLIPINVSAFGTLSGKTLVQITCGTLQSYALDATGTLHAWGYNNEGELGNNTTSLSNVVPIITNTNTPYATTGTGLNVLSANPTITGTLNTSNITASGIITGNGSGLTNLSATNITTGTLAVANGGTGTTTSTGTGSNVLSTDPTFAGTVNASNINFTGTLTQNGVAFTSGGGGSNTVSTNASFIPGSNNAYDIGSTTNRWKNLYLSGNAISFGNGTVIDSQNWSYLVNYVLPTIPAPTVSTDVKYVATGSSQNHNAIIINGLLYTFGKNDQGQLGLGDLVDRVTGPVLVPGLSNVKQVVCGQNFTIALITNGTCIAFGNNTYGQLGQTIATVPYSTTPLTIPGLSGVSSVDCGYSHALFCLTNGTVLGLGTNSKGQLGNGGSLSVTNATLVTMATPTTTATDAPTIAGFLVRSLACSSYASIILLNNGSAYVCGDNTYNQLGVAFTTMNYNSTPGLLTTVSQIVKVACGSNHVIAICQNGDVWTFGYNNLGQLGLGNTNTYTVPTKAIVAVSNTSTTAGALISADGGIGHTVLAMNDASGTIYVFGDNTYGQLGVGQSYTSKTTPTVLTGYNGVLVGCGGLNTTMLLSNNTLVSFGNNTNGQTGDGQAMLSSQPYRYFPNVINPVSGKSFMVSSSVCNNSAYTDTDGVLYINGNNGNGQIGDNSTQNRTVFTPVSLLDTRIVQVSVGQQHTIALDSTGHVYAWGYNGQGQLGNNNAGNESHIPINVSSFGTLSGKSIVAIASGGLYTLALDSTGQVHAWGYNQYGQLGNNTSANTSPIPINVSTFGSLSGRTVVAITCGSSHTLALDSTGQVHAWGNNNNVQLGNNNAGTNSLIPINVTTSTTNSISGRTVVAIAGGIYHTIALDSIGQVHAWGASPNGQVGNNTTTVNYIPTNVSSFGSISGRTVVAIATGSAHTLALDSTGQVHAWGWNPYGGLGNNTSNNQSIVPINISSFGTLSGKTVVAIACGTYHTMALDSTGQVHAWGNNGSGQLGINSNTTPIIVPTLSYLTNRSPLASPPIVSNGVGLHKLIRDPVTLNALTAAGSNNFGQLGLPSAGTYSFNSIVPTGSPFGSNIVAAANSQTHSALIVAGSSNLFMCGLNSSYQCGYGVSSSNPTVFTKVNGVSTPSDVACGSGFTVILNSDNTLSSFGGNFSGCLGIGSSNYSFSNVSATAISNLTNIKVIKAGTSNMLAIDSSSNLWVWGDNTYGQLGQGKTIGTNVITPTLLSLTGTNATSVIDAAFGDKHLIVLGNDKTVYSCGLNLYGQLGNYMNQGTSVANSNLNPVFLQQDPNNLVNFPIGFLTANSTFITGTSYGSGTNVVSASTNSTVASAWQAFDSSSTTTWSTNAGTYVTSTGAYTGSTTTAISGSTVLGEWIQIQFPVKVVAASVLMTPTVVGQVPAAYTLLGSVDGITFTTLGVVTGNSGIAQVTTSVIYLGSYYFFRLVFTSGIVSGSGFITIQNLAISGSAVCEAYPVSVTCGTNHSVIQLANNTIMTFGRNDTLQLGGSFGAYSWTPSKPKIYNDVVRISASQDVTYVEAYMGQVSNAITVPRMRGYGLFQLAKYVTTIVSGCNTTECSAYISNGMVYIWGYNLSGQLGNNTTTLSRIPINISAFGSINGKTMVAISCGYQHTIALDSTSQVHAWGNNNSGQLGNNTTSNNIVPINISTFGSIIGRNVVAITCGGNHTLALDSTGQIHAWGYNSFGQLGNGTTSTIQIVPINVSTFGSINGKTVVAISCGANHTVVLDSTGKVHAWGYNNYGQLGNSTTSTNQIVPINVSSFGSISGKTVVAISCGSQHTAASDSTGKVHTWGYNYVGGLGNNTTTDSATPINVSSFGSLSGRTISTIACGQIHTIALDSSGQVHGWGRNSEGELGNGTQTDSYTPILIYAGSIIGRTIVAISCGEYHILALDSTGQMHAWGYNQSGQIGINSMSQCIFSPVLVTNFYAAVTTPTLFMNFTGQHRCFIQGYNNQNMKEIEGRIVCANQDKYITTSEELGGDYKFQVGQNAITTNDALPLVALSFNYKDKSVFGVVSLSTNYGYGDDPTQDEIMLQASEGDVRAEINAIGEGGIWIVNVTGTDTLTAGDYITSSLIPGYGCKQDDDLLHNYTVAKMTMNCDFNPPMINTVQLVQDSLGNNVLDPDTRWPTYSQVLDSTGAQVTEQKYKTRYVLADGTCTTKDEYNNLNAATPGSAFVAAFVGCTYHCG